MRPRPQLAVNLPAILTLAVVALLNLAADVVYGIADPRIKVA